MNYAIFSLLLGYSDSRQNIPKGWGNCLEIRTGKGTMMRGRVQAAACVLAAVSLTTVSTTAAQVDDAKLRAYGKQLSAQCAACHRIDGTDNGIPSIVGWPPEDFMFVLKAYRDGGRTDPAMVSAVRELNETQIRALAIFFGSLKPSVRLR